VKSLKNIKYHYRPIQPTVTQKSKEVVYLERTPNPKIDTFIYCFWQLKTQKKLAFPFIYRVVSDGCIDIFFNHKHPKDSFVMGFCRKYTEFPIGDQFDYIGVRFLPSVFPMLFGVNAKTLSNQSQQLERVLPEIAYWIQKNIKKEASFDTIIELFTDQFQYIINNTILETDGRFFNALETIFKNNGVLDIEKDLNTGISPRQLRRIFNFYIGTTPKAFSNVVRFQHILNAKPSNQSLRENKLYFDAGFFDQAHFIKNFKTFYGVTPSEAFQ